MTRSRVFQALNTSATPQSGYNLVATTTIDIQNGGDLLLGVSGSAWSDAGQPLSLAVWLDGRPTGGELAVRETTNGMHMSLGHTWVHCPGVAPGSHNVALVAGPETRTDNNDVVMVTVWELGDDVRVAFSGDAPAPFGRGGQVLMDERVGSDGIQMLVSGGAAGWVVGSGETVGAYLTIDDDPPVRSEVFADNVYQVLATVPTTFVAPQPLERGQHLMTLSAAWNTETDVFEMGYLTVIDWTRSWPSPIVRPLSAPLQNARALSQTGEGGTVASVTFESDGGTLLLSTHVSAWTPSADQMLRVAVEIDGTSVGSTQVYANLAQTHMTMVSNDIVATGIPAGQHTLELIGEGGTHTDGNDRVSVTVVEFPPPVPSTILDNFVARANVQSGGKPVATTTITVPDRGDLLLGVSASAWSIAQGQMSLDVLLDGQPTGGRLALYANWGGMHLSLGHTWVHCPDVQPGEHTISLVAGPTTVTDDQDLANVTTWALGDGLTVPFSGDEPEPQGTGGQVLMKGQVETKGIGMLVSFGASGQVSTHWTTIGANLTIDDDPPVASQVYANNAIQHLATVPTALAVTLERGQHLVSLSAQSGTETNASDTGHLTVIDWANPSCAPAFRPLDPPLQNVPALLQRGNGGTIASATFEKDVGALLISAHLSAWTQSPNTGLVVAIEIDGTPVGWNSIYANFANTHMPMISTAHWAPLVPAGQHTLKLISSGGTQTDSNDRVSVTILEFFDYEPGA